MKEFRSAKITTKKQSASPAFAGEALFARFLSNYAAAFFSVAATAPTFEMRMP